MQARKKIKKTRRAKKAKVVEGVQRQNSTVTTIHHLQIKLNMTSCVLNGK